MRSVEINGSRIHILGVVKGLVSEEKKVDLAVKEFLPDAIGLSVSKEQLAALRSRDAWCEYELSPLECAYKTLMQDFGEVRIPSPAFLRAMELADAQGIPVIPIDMNDLDYTEEYCQKVGAVDLMREGAFSRAVRRMKFNGSSPESLALDWDRKVNKAKGFRKLEKQRERHMAMVMVRLSKRYRNVLGIVDYERFEGVARILDDAKV